MSEIVNATSALLSAEERELFEKSLLSVPSTSYRPNPYKKASLPDGKSVPWCPEGRLLPERISFVADPLWHTGAYYVQESSSMFLCYLIRELQKDQSFKHALDLCAAPGGKSTLLAGILPPDALICSNEVNRKRSSILSENIIKWGHPGSLVTTAEAKQWAGLTGVFDLILVDAPCSGEGMVRKDPYALKQWNESLIETCCKIQHDILREIWPSLKQNGILIYSTCTFNLKENEEQVKNFCSEHQAEILKFNLPKEWNIFISEVDGGHAYRFFQHRTPGEGFFVSVLRKTGEAERMKKRRGKSNSSWKRVPANKVENKNWLKADTPLVWYQREEHFAFFPEASAELLDIILDHLPSQHGPYPFASLKGKSWNPDPALPFSMLFNSADFPRVELTLEDAQKFLRHDALLPNTQEGWNVATYQKIPIGLFKKIKNRINNYFPMEWRIRKEISDL